MTEKFENDDITSYGAVGTVRDRRGVLRVTGLTVKECDVAGSAILGVNVGGGVTSPSDVGVIDEGHPFVTTGGEYDDGDPLAMDGQGRFVKALAGDVVVAEAEEPSGAANLQKRAHLLGPAQYALGQARGTRIATATPVAVSALTDDVVVVNLLVAGATAVNLPAGRKNLEFVIKDGKGDAAAHNITVDANAAETIDGAANKVIAANYGSLRLRHNGVEWNVI